MKRHTPMRRNRPVKARKATGYADTQPKPLKAAVGHSGQRERARERRLADARWQVDVVQSARGVCELCGKRRHDLGGHHLWPKSRCRGAMRWLRHDRRNGVALGWGCCHLPLAEDKPKEFERRFRERFPERWAWVLEQVKEAKK